MKKIRLVAVVVMLVSSIAITVLANTDNDAFSSHQLTEDEIITLKSVDVATILKTANVTNVLTETAFNTNTEDSLSLNNTIVVKKKDAVKTTKKRTTQRNKENKKLKAKYLGTFKVTGYCKCSSCCGKSNGITASGTVAKAGRTIAADTSKLPFGTKVVIDGHTYTVEDRGGAINGNKIDMFFDSHSQALQWGVRYCEVYVNR